MNNYNIHSLVLILTLLVGPGNSFSLLSQEADSSITAPAADSALEARINNMTKDDIARLTLEDLLMLPMEYLIRLSQKLGISVEELLNMKVTVSSRSELTPRESPGILSIITEEEIRKSGARDLIDVLRLVPGYAFGHDDVGVIGLGARGLWGHEGKILMLIDGQEMNDLYYSTLPIANHYPVSNIKRIEIIRGPGSSIYGGNAELGVINIITKKGEHYGGGTVSSTGSIMNSSFGRSTLDFGVGSSSENFDFSLSGFASHASLSTSSLQIPYHVIDVSDNSLMTHNYHLNLNMRYKNLKINFLYDDYHTSSYRFNYIDTNATPHRSVAYHLLNYFKLYAIDIRYEKKLSDKVSLIPRLNYKNNLPYYKVIKNAPFDYTFSNQVVNQYMAGLMLKYCPGDYFDMNMGTEFSVSEGHVLSDSLFNFAITGTPYASFYNQGYYLQAILKSQPVNVTLGGRYDIFGWMHVGKDGISYSPFYNAFSPRIGFTKVWDKFHYKLLLSKAFRAPSVGIFVNNPIDPETTFIQEIELGYKFNKKMFVTCNLFNINIDNTIIYVPNSFDKYYNYKQMGTTGVEIEFRYKAARMYHILNYSYYHSGSFVFLPAPDSGQSRKFIQYKKSEVWHYHLYQDNVRLLGFPNHKITLTSSYNFSSRLTLTNTMTYLSSCYAHYAYADPDSLGNATNRVSTVLRKVKGYLLWNLYLSYQVPMVQGLSMGIGFYDILNSNPGFVQPYYGLSSPFPAPGREILFRITYDFGLKKEE